MNENNNKSQKVEIEFQIHKEVSQSVSVSSV